MSSKAWSIDEGGFLGGLHPIENAGAIMIGTPVFWRNSNVMSNSSRYNQLSRVTSAPVIVMTTKYDTRHAIWFEHGHDPVEVGFKY